MTVKKVGGNAFWPESSIMIDCGDSIQSTAGCGGCRSVMQAQNRQIFMSAWHGIDRSVRSSVEFIGGCSCAERVKQRSPHPGMIKAHERSATTTTPA